MSFCDFLSFVTLPGDDENKEKNQKKMPDCHGNTS